MSYAPPPSYRQDPVGHLPCGDELRVELTAAIAYRFDVYGERHVHPKRGGCEACAEAAADTVVRFLEVNTRVIGSDALAPDEHERARRAAKAIPYLGTGGHLRLTGSLGADPAYPTVADLLADVETIRDAMVDLLERDRERDGELRRYRKWRAEVHALAAEVVEQYDAIVANQP